jgi:hypothetical protein
MIGETTSTKHSAPWPKRSSVGEYLESLGSIFRNSYPCGAASCAWPPQTTRKELEEYFDGLDAMFNQYTIASAGAIITFISQANIQTGHAPDGTPTLSATGNNFVYPGDRVTITFNPVGCQTLRMEISTLYDNHKVTMAASFKKIKSGHAHLESTTIEIPDKTIKLQIHNYDHAPDEQFA